MPDPGGEPFGLPFGDATNDAPLLREIQRVLLSGSGPINWELARQIGVAVASWGGDDPPPDERDRATVSEAVRVAELAVEGATGLSAPAEIASVQAVRRAEWVEENTRSLRDVLEPVGSKLAGLLRDANVSAMPAEAASGPEMLGALMGQMAPLLLGAQVGAVLGTLAQRALGLFDLAVPRRATLVQFVVPNIAAFERDWSLEPMEFRTWVALHEVTHRFELARPWIGPHFVGLVRDMVEHAEIDLTGLQQQLESLDMSNPEALTEAFERAGNLFGDATTPEQRLRVARVQAFVAAVEGYADHVVALVGRRMLPSYPRIDEAIVRHREGRHTEHALERLLGLTVKVEHYRLGEAFCDRSAELTDERILARMWDAAELLPSMPELEEPTLWLARVA